MGYLRERSQGYPTRQWIYTRRLYSPSGYLQQTLRETRYGSPVQATMVDYVGGNRHAFKPVTHRKFTWQAEGPAGMVNTSGYVLLFDPYAVPKDMSLAQIQHYFDFGGGLDQSSVEFRDFEYDAFFNLTDLSKRQVDVYNVLRDIAEIGKLVGQLKGIALSLYHLAERFFQIVRHLHYRDLTFSGLRRLAAESSNGFLIHEFGILPLIREFDDLMGKAKAIERSLRFIRNTCGKSFPVHYTRTKQIPHSEVLYGTDSWFVGGAVYFTNISEHVTFSATGSCHNGLSLSAIDGLLGQFAAFSSGLGINRAFEFLWDIVPFSFVVDWFFSVDKWIKHNFTVDQFGSPFTLRNTGTSIKTTFEADVEVRSDYLVGSPIRLGHISYQEYTRHVGLRWGFDILAQWPDLSPIQQGILAALATQRVG